MRVRAWRVRRAAVVAAAGLLIMLATTGEARGSPGWSWPVAGDVITRYANDDANAYAGGMHRGIDIAASPGTAVRAAREGEVTFAGSLGYSGLTVAVRTVDGYVTSYLHLGTIAVRRGQAVHGGARIGEAGTTGRRSAPQPHLHFGVRRAGRRYVDPLTLLPPLPAASPPTPPVPAPAPAPALPEPAPVRAVATPERARVVPRSAPKPARVPGHLPLPAPSPEPAPAPATSPAHRPQRVPVASAPRREHVLRERPVRAPWPAAAPRAQSPTRDWGRPLALAGLGLLVLALFGRSALRAARDANGAVSGRLNGAIARAVRPARGWLPRWR
jgi:peptidase M23-like protein